MTATERCFPRAWSSVSVIFAIFIVSVGVLFGVVYRVTGGYLIDQVDARLTRESVQLIHRTREDARANIDARGKRELAGQRPYGMFDRTGARVAGNIDSLPSRQRDWTPYDYVQRVVNEHGTPSTRHYRAVISSLPDGERIVVGQAIDDIKRFDDMLIWIALSGLAGTVLLGAVCGYALHRASTRRIRAIRESCQEIVSSQFERRLPLSGSNDDMDALVVIVNSMLDDIQQLVIELRGVCAWIAHDLRTPMTSLRAGLERVRRSANSITEYETAVDHAVVQADRVLDRFSALLRIAEIEAHAQRQNFCPIDLAGIMNDVAELYEPLAEQSGIHMEIETARLSPLLGDRDLIFGAIENLILNSLKYTPAGGTVALRLEMQPPHAVVEISDTGPGIAKAERDAVLRPFYRSVRTVDMPTPGHGLGLSLVAATARLHNASLEIEDAEPGCRIKLRFPLSSHAAVPYVSPGVEPGVSTETTATTSAAF